MENSEIGSVSEIPIATTNSSSSGRRRRGPLRSQTLDIVLRIFSICNAAPFHVIQNSEQTSVDEAREDGTQVESAEHDHNVLGEKKEHFFQKVNTVNFDAKSQDNHLPTNEDVEEGEISVPQIDTKSVSDPDSEPPDFTGSKTGLRNDDNIIPFCTEAVANGDVAGVINKTTRNLVDYSEIAVHAKSQECVKQATLKLNATKNQDLVKDNGAKNNGKRQGSCIEEERRNKKSKKSVDPTTSLENIALLGEHLESASQEVVDASANKDACYEKRKKRVLTEERKAKKKRKDRIKRAEKNRKLGVKRLKLQPVVKEKKITYCRHYMNGRCHEGEKCKFSHDTIPLTKSKPCCHFARHACMKGDDCPFDHQLSKYPCNNYQTKGSCNRGSDCMFSHEVQPSDDSLNELNKSRPEQKPPSNSGSKKVETNSCLVPKFVDITPKSTQPPKGINFFSQEKLPLESRKVDSEVKEITKTPTVVPRGINFLSFGKKPGLESCPSPKVDSEAKEITKMSPLVQDSEEKTKGPPVVHDSEEISKTPTVVPRGINFLSFGKKPGLDYSNPFKISNRVEKPRISDVVGEGLRSSSTVNMVNKVTVDFSADKPSSSKKPIPMMSFMSSTSQKVLQSTLAFASELESGVKSKV